MFEEDFFHEKKQVNLTRGRAMRVIKRDEAQKTGGTTNGKLGGTLAL